MLIDIKDIYKIYNEGQESEVRALDGVTLQIGKAVKRFGDDVILVDGGGREKSGRHRGRED